MANEFFEVLRGFSESRTLIFDGVSARGLMIAETAADVTKGEAATAASKVGLGILDQEVTTLGPDFLTQDAGLPITEVKIGSAATMRGGSGEIVVQGDDLVEGSLSGGTVGDQVGVLLGKYRLAVTGDIVYGRLLEKDVDGNTGRVRLEMTFHEHKIAL